MIRMIFALMIWAPAVCAQDFSGLARIDQTKSAITDTSDGLQIELELSQVVPYRVFSLDSPQRLVVDFREIDWTGVEQAALDQSRIAQDIRFGTFQTGWSRLIVDLDEPVTLKTAEMKTFQQDGTATLTLKFETTDPETFAEKSGAPVGSVWDATAAAPSLPAPTPDDGPLTVVIDPGHGGIDPGAVQGGVHEADLMLQLAIELAEALNRTGSVRAILTRDADVFVPLEGRMSIARAAKADLLISLHADALEVDQARGGSVYTLNAEGSDLASARMAERHERGDLLAGVDLSGQDDRVATVLMDLARTQTEPQSQRFADAAVEGLRAAGARLNSKPRREGRLAVLNAPDFASVLIEVGFLSNASDREMLSAPATRAPIVTGIVTAVLAWAQDEAVRAPLLRQ
ncbi:N-acetylmuramoyl-L-alanine amidase [Yoonia sp.]|uniref:N-acetylmuramoyl-L-alanine amidase n=1 Tax=Yoonia sp. TaxID=2212373 RepID=UPI0023999561|nr:N-acetylmuramoyl-L-alanine amidase [Yoonia sp.]MDE0850408.1 N-acetylmuramoyl-L-alanine amidase [Yoonia sp.]